MGTRVARCLQSREFLSNESGRAKTHGCENPVLKDGEEVVETLEFRIGKGGIRNALGRRRGHGGEYGGVMGICQYHI